MHNRLFILLCFVACTSQAQIITTFQPNAAEGKDTKVWSIENIVNFGDYTELRAMQWTWDGEEGTERSLLQFNLNNIPQNAEVCYAYLSLFRNDSTSTQFNSSLSGPNVTLLCRVITPWEENLVTWNTQPSYTMTNHVTIPESTLPFEDVLDIDVTDLVQDMINDPANSFGFELFLETEEYYRRRVFATSDNPDSTRHPKLVVCYTLPVEIDQATFTTNRVYPNPIRQGDLHLTTNFAYTADATFAIFNNMGLEICKIPLTQGATTREYCIPSAYIDALPTGQYALQISNSAGSQTTTFMKL